MKMVLGCNGKDLPTAVVRCAAIRLPRLVGYRTDRGRLVRQRRSYNEPSCRGIHTRPRQGGTCLSCTWFWLRLGWNCSGRYRSRFICCSRLAVIPGGRRYRDDKDFAALEPEQSPFWYGTSSGVLNYGDDILKYVSEGRIRVHRADISHLSDHAVHIQSEGKERTLAVDALVACTGYSAKPVLPFSPLSLQVDLGVPSTSVSKSQSAVWDELDKRADLIIGSKYPRLLYGPYHSPTSSIPTTFHPGASSAAETPYTPWRLYRGIAPPELTQAGDHSLVFINMFSSVHSTIRVEIQCLWALAYFEHELPCLEKDREDGRVLLETSPLQRFAQHRAPYGNCRSYPDLVADQVPYWDLLVHDLGLETRRKGGWRELLEPYSLETTPDWWRNGSARKGGVWVVLKGAGSRVPLPVQFPYASEI